MAQSTLCRPPSPQRRAIPLLLLLAAASRAAPAPTTPTPPLTGDALEAALEVAEAAQDVKEAAPRPVEAQLVSIDPPARLRAGTGDLDTAGPCEAELDAACSEVRPGSGRLAECLIGALADDAADGAPPLVASGPCRADLLAFVSERADNVNADVPLADACAGDAEALCADVEDDMSLLGCLREAKEELTPACAAVVTQRQADGEREMEEGGGGGRGGRRRREEARV